MLTSHDHQVTILDFSAEPYTTERLQQTLHQADAVGITILTYTLHSATNLITQIRNNRPDLPIIIGGPHSTLFPQKVLKETQADISVQGDGEPAITGIAEALQGTKQLKDIPGIYYREDNKIKAGKPPKLIKDLNTIPIPDRAPVSRYQYGREYNPHIKHNEFTSLITSRGCPYSCRFCSRHSISMKHFRTRSADNVLTELTQLQNQGYHYIQIADDSFLADRKQAEHLLDSIIQAQLSLKLIVTGARVDAITPAILQKMRQAGVYHIYYGLESGNQEILNFYNKKTTIHQIQTAVQHSHKLGFFIVGSFILGAPLETIDHFHRTISFAKTLPLDAVSFLPLRYMAGSDLWEQSVQEEKIKENEYLLEAGSEHDLSTLPKSIIHAYCVKAHQQFYLRPQFVLRLLKKSLRNDDLGFLQSYLSLLLNNIRQSFSFFHHSP